MSHLEHELPKPLDPTQQVKLLKEMKNDAAAKAAGSKPDKKRNKMEPSSYVIKKNKRKLASGESQLMLALSKGGKQLLQIKEKYAAELATWKDKLNAGTTTPGEVLSASKLKSQPEY